VAPFRYTTTKQGLAPLLGLEGLRRLMEIKKQEQISIPVCAIGGITLSDVPDVMATGVNGIAVSGAVLQATDPVRAMRDFLHADES